jgi:hypothetical protein
MNMTFTQLKDILRRIKQIHYEVSHICETGERDRDRRTSLLVDFFGQWEDRLGWCLDALESEERQAFLNTWVQFSGMEELEKALDAIREVSANDPEKLVEKALVLQEEIIRLLEYLAGHLPSRDVQDRLGSLIALERKAARDLGSAIVMERDA